jgi:hypothetical protein
MLSEPLIVDPMGVFDYTSNAKRFAFGPAVEIQIPKGWAGAFDAIWNHQGYRSEATMVSNSMFTRTTIESTTTGNVWEFPLMLKKYVSFSRTRVFGEAGFSTRHTSATTQSRQTVEPTICGGPISCAPHTTTGSAVPTELAHPWTTGPVFGGGVDLRFQRIHVAPEFRYTRWLDRAFEAPTGGLRSDKNEFGLLLRIRIDTFTFGGGSRP